jgi:GYF domain 2
MSNRSWFFAANGQQQGPYPEAQFRDLIARGTVNPQTLVWSEGMAGWVKAGEVPGLMSGASAPPAMPGGGPMMNQGGYAAAGYGDGPLSFEAPIWGLLGRTLLMVLGVLLVIPAPWVATMFYRYIVQHVHVPSRPNLDFTGQPMDIWWVFMLLGLCSYAGQTGLSWLPLVLIPLQAYLSWMAIRWVASNISSNGQKLPIQFTGSLIGYIGWYVLLMVSFISIIGWAWVTSAWMRWNCRNVSGTQHEVIFTGSGLQVLWRTLVFGIACAFIIPIPWMLRWFGRWYTSQVALVEPGYTNANA